MRIAVRSCFAENNSVRAQLSHQSAFKTHHDGKKVTKVAVNVFRQYLEERKVHEKELLSRQTLNLQLF